MLKGFSVCGTGCCNCFHLQSSYTFEVEATMRKVRLCLSPSFRWTCIGIICSTDWCSCRVITCSFWEAIGGRKGKSTSWLYILNDRVRLCWKFFAVIIDFGNQEGHCSHVVLDLQGFCIHRGLETLSAHLKKAEEKLKWCVQVLATG